MRMSTHQRVEGDLDGCLIILEPDLDIDGHLHEGIDPDDSKVCAAQIQHKLWALLVKHFEHLQHQHWRDQTHNHLAHLHGRRRGLGSCVFVLLLRRKHCRRLALLLHGHVLHHRRRALSVVVLIVVLRHCCSRRGSVILYRFAARPSFVVIGLALGDSEHLCLVKPMLLTKGGQ